MARKRKSSSADKSSLLSRFRSLPVAEQDNFLRALASDERVAAVLRALLREAASLEITQRDKAIEYAMREIEYLREGSMPKVRARNRERDLEIVRLHDEEDFTFGEIPAQLARHPEFAGKKGQLLSRKAVEQAYRRFKKR
jgi:hypothetical protein